MELSVTSKTEYDVNLFLSESEMNQLLDELEGAFSSAAKEGRAEYIPMIIEFKNLLTLSINNK